MVAVRWKLPTTSTVLDLSKTQKLRIEWSDTQSLKWKHKEFVVAEEDKKSGQSEGGCSALINVGCSGTYLFRVRHYYQSKWSKMSNTRSVAIAGVAHDSWDPLYHGASVSIEGTVITMKKKQSGYESAFLSNTATEGRHHWRFRLEASHKSVTTKSGPRIFGVWRMDHEDNVDINQMVNTHFTNNELVDPNSNQAHGKGFGDKCKEGDVVEMVLDLEEGRLHYMLNGEEYGKPVVVATAHYKAAVSFYHKDDRIKLLEYKVR